MNSTFLIEKNIRHQFEGISGSGLLMTVKNFTDALKRSGHQKLKKVEDSLSLVDEMFLDFHERPTLSTYHLVKSIALCCFFIVGATGNIATLVRMYRIRRRRSTMNLLITHLALADLLVNFFCIIGDAIWGVTVEWLAGNFMCKLYKFMQVFGLYLSNYIIVVISIDRCSAILDPISKNKAPKRTKSMLIVAYTFSFLLSVPQALIFSSTKGPFRVEFYQCVTLQGYTEEWQEPFYSLVCIFFGFIFPLIVMIIAYSLIFITITKQSKSFQRTDSFSNVGIHNQLNNKDNNRAISICNNSSSFFNSHNNVGSISVGAALNSFNPYTPVRSQLLSRAKKKSLKMTSLIVFVFILCWTPYYACFLYNTFQLTVFGFDGSHDSQLSGERSQLHGQLLHLRENFSRFIEDVQQLGQDYDSYQQTVDTIVGNDSLQFHKMHGHEGAEEELFESIFQKKSFLLKLEHKLPAFSERIEEEEKGRMKLKAEKKMLTREPKGPWRASISKKEFFKQSEDSEDEGVSLKKKNVTFDSAGLPQTTIRPKEDSIQWKLQHVIETFQFYSNLQYNYECLAEELLSKLEKLREEEKLVQSNTTLTFEQMFGVYLFFFGMSNSVINPLIYGAFVGRKKKQPCKPHIEMRKTVPSSKPSSSSSSKLVQCRFHACVGQPHVNKICSQGKSVMSRKLIHQTRVRRMEEEKRNGKEHPSFHQPFHFLCIF